MKRKLFKESLRGQKPDYITEKQLFEIAVRAVVPTKIGVLGNEDLKKQIKETYKLLKEVANEL